MIARIDSLSVAGMSSERMLPAENEFWDSTDVAMSPFVRTAIGAGTLGVAGSSYPQSGVCKQLKVALTLDLLWGFPKMLVS